MSVYYADTDENGVLCVDQVSGETGDPEEVVVRQIAASYPDTIYFIHP